MLTAPRPPACDRSSKPLSLTASWCAMLITTLARLVTGARSLWLGCAPQPVQRLYFANHSSHGDFVLLWSALPPALRHRTRPVAGADYWLASRLRRYIIQDVFRGVLVDRRKEGGSDPLRPLREALAEGDSLILFPEGTRNQTPEPLPFKSGLFHLAKAYPKVELVPVWIANLQRVMPKGRALPLPLLCTLSFGEPLHLAAEEDKQAFLERARTALLALRPDHLE